MPGSSSTRRMLGFGAVLIAPPQKPSDVAASGMRICCPNPIRSPPRFFLRRPAPGGGQWQVQAPCHQTECRLEAVGKNRQKSLDEIPDRFPARCLKRLLSQNLVPQLFAGGDRAADRG